MCWFLNVLLFAHSHFVALSCTVNSRYSGHPGDGHLVSVIARVRSNGARTKFPNFSVYRMSVVNNSVFGLKCLVYSNI